MCSGRFVRYLKLYSAAKPLKAKTRRRIRNSVATSVHRSPSQAPSLEEAAAMAAMKQLA